MHRRRPPLRHVDRPRPPARQHPARRLGRRRQCLADRVIRVLAAVRTDAGELLTAQLAAYVHEAQTVHRADIPPLCDGLSDVREAITTGQVLIARDVDGTTPGRLVGGVRLTAHDGAGYLGRLAVVPDRQRERIAGRLIDAAISRATERFSYIDLVTLRRSGHNAAMYTRRGWHELPADAASGHPAVDDTGVELLWMRKHLTK